jgi:hypothetical protein
VSTDFHVKFLSKVDAAVGILELKVEKSTLGAWRMPFPVRSPCLQYQLPHDTRATIPPPPPQLEAKVSERPSITITCSGAGLSKCHKQRGGGGHFLSS